MMKNAPFRSHLPLVLLIDISKSTEDIRELINKCQKQMLRAMMEDVALRGCVYLYILHFNGACEPVVEFELLDSLYERGALNDDSDELDIKKSYGCTNTGRAIMTALQAVDEQKTEWRKNRAENVFQPLMFLLTDGYPDAGLGASEEEKAAVERAYRNAAEEIQRREKEDGNGRAKITFAAAGVQRRNGCSANIPRLKELTSYADHVVAVTDDADGSVDVAGLSEFFGMIYQATTTTVNRGTPLEDVVGISFGAAEPK